MKHSILMMSWLAAATLPSAAQAGPFADDLGRCTVNATTVADRTILLRWMFVTAAANPALSDLSSTTPASRDRAIRAAAGVFSRIMVTDCRSQMIAALRNEGAEALSVGFGTLGRVAGREMMSSPTGTASLDQLVDRMDMDALVALGREAGVPLGPPRR